MRLPLLTVCFLPAAGLAEPGPDLVVVGTATAASDPRGSGARTQVLEPADHAGPLLDAGDLLDAAVGAHIRRSGGAGRAQSVQIRGAGAHQVRVFLDGTPLGVGRGAVDLSTLPVGAIERLVVVRGAAAAAWGSGAQGGVIDVQTRRPRLGAHADGRLRLGSSRLLQLDGGWGWGAPDAGVIGLVGFSRSDGDFTYEDVNGRQRSRVNNQHWQLTALSRGRLEVGGHRLSVVADAIGGARGEPGSEQQPRAAASSTRRRGGLALTWQGPEWAESVRAEATVYGRVSRSLFDDPQPFFDGLNRFTLLDRSLGARGSAVWRPAGHRVGLVAELGWQGAQTQAEGTQTVQRAETRALGSVALSETWRPLERLRLTGVLRLDGAEGRPVAWVPHAGFGLRVLEHLWLEGNVGRAFRDPSFDELFFEGPGVRGNPDLQAEDGWGWDAGLHYARRWGLAEWVVFGQRYDRLILWVPEGAYRVRARDDFAADVLGTEARLGLWHGPLDASLAYTWLFTEAEAPPAPLPFRPKHRIYATVAAAVGDGARIYGRWDWRSAVTVDRFGARSLPAYGLWDLGVDGTLGAGLALGLEVRNLLNTQGLDAVQQPRPGRTVILTLGLGQP